MKRLSGEKDFLCIAGTPSEITKSLNKISCRYDLTVISSHANDKGLITVIIERRMRPGPSRCSEEG